MLRVDKLTKHYGPLKAVDNLSFTVDKGQIFGLVGESGCGKSTAAKLIMGLIPPTSGKITYQCPKRSLQIVFQDPYSSLNPRMTVLDIVAEGIDIHRLSRGKERKRRVGYLLERVGLSPAHINRYPHEFSGGQRQRIGIARALAIEPEFLILDEPVSALDLSIQAQVIRLLQELQSDMELTYLFITHDLGLVKHLCTHTGVMHQGTLVECAPTPDLFERPAHPYTRNLLSAVPLPDPTLERAKPQPLFQLVKQTV